MWQHWQKIISEEAKKYGYGNNELEQTETNEIFEDYKETLKGVRKVKVLKPIQFAKLDVGTTYVLMYDTSYMGEPMYKLGADGKKTSGRISGKKIAKAIEGGLIQALKEETEETQFVEDGEIEEAKEKYLTGPGKKDPKRIIGIYTMKGKWIKDMNSEKEAANFVNKSWGESVEEEIEEGVRMMAGAEKMIKDDPAGGSSMVSSLRNIKKQFETKPTGSVLVLTKEKDPESMSIKIYAPSDFASLTKGFSKKPEAKIGSKGSWSGGEVTVIAIKEETEIAEQFKAGDKVKVPHKGKMVSGKIVRFDSGGTSKAQQHGGGYVVDVGEPASILVPKQKVQKEETEVAEANLTEGPYTVIPYPMITKGLRDAASPFSIQFVDYKGKVLYQYPKQVNSIQALPAHMDGIFKEMRDSGWLLRHGGASLKLWHRVNILDKDGKVVNSIAAFDVPKKRSEEFELSENDWVNIHESAALLAKTAAKEITAKARELGVKIIVQSNTSVSFSKNFTRGSKEEFFKAYSDCDKVRRMVRFKSRVNEWGASTGGIGLGAQDDIAKGVVTIHKSGDGAAYLLKELDKSN
jgi:hypothetical protein